jgi:hypothetical protein
MCYSVQGLNLCLHSLMPMWILDCLVEEFRFRIGGNGKTKVFFSRRKFMINRRI